MFVGTMADFIDLQPSTIFAGDFRIIKPLSQGGMGAVYVVEQISTGKQRALKLMLPQLVTDPTLRKRFEQEARVGALIESEHVVEVVGAGVDAATKMPWLAMELLSGDDLSHVVAQRGARPPTEVLVIFEQLCHAVGAAHAAGIVHRDLKPENIFLARSRRAGEQSTVKVLDFGIAKIVAEAKTARTAAIGSPMWMAPEQTDRAKVTPATDVWALGLIAFNLLTGRFFWKTANFEDTTVTQLMREILFEPLPPASHRARELEANTSLPAGFDEWFIRCVSREASGRFQDAHQALSQLRPVLSSQGHAPAPTAPAGLIQRTERAAPVHVPVAVTVDTPFGATEGSGTGVAGAYGRMTGGTTARPISSDQGEDDRVELPRSSATRIVVPVVAALVAILGIGGVVAIRFSGGKPAADSSQLTETARSASPIFVGTPALSAAVSSPTDSVTGAAVALPLPMGPPSASSARGADTPASAAQRTATPSAPNVPAAHTTPSPVPTSVDTAKGGVPSASPGPPLYAPTLDDTERQLALQGTQDSKMHLKQLLEPRVVGGKASASEINLLITTCKELGDRGCVEQARAIRQK
jgi:serine/threonine protein kinase